MEAEATPKMAPDRCDVAIVGAGAAGLTAAIFCAQHGADLRIALLDGAKKIGAKILVAGGGRCNVTHQQARPADFNAPKRFVQKVLKAFDEKRTAEWFASMGVGLKTEPTGKLFPTTDKARTVLEALLTRCRSLGVSPLTEHRVQRITKCDEGFAIEHSRGTLRAGRLILATGGRSLPRTGSDGEGWRIVRELGHTVTDTLPALVPLVLEEESEAALPLRPLSGLTCTAELITRAEGKVVDRRRGSLLITHFGLSGPLTLDTSRHYLSAEHEGLQPTLSVNWLAGDGFEQAERWLIDSAQRSPRRPMGSLLADLLPQRLGETLLNSAEIAPDKRLADLPREPRRRLVHRLTDTPLRVAGPRGWNYAEVTAGGVPLSEVEPRTMGSRKVEGLHLIGEMLDCDARIGGFNFQWAWSTGHIAGRSVAEALSPSVAATAREDR